MDRVLDDEDRALEKLKEQMTGQQRKDMSDLLKAELNRRMKEKLKAGKAGRPKDKSTVKSSNLSSALGTEDVGDMYSELDGKVRALRLKKLEAKLADAKRQKKKFGKYMKPKNQSAMLGSELPEELLGGASLSIPRGRMPAFPLKNMLIMLVILGLAVMKVMLSGGAVNASIDSEDEGFSGGVEYAIESEEMPPKERIVQKKKETRLAKRITRSKSKAANYSRGRLAHGWSKAEKRVLTDLDARRVELEKREIALESKEAELKTQAQALSERVLELRTLTSQLAKAREEKDHRYEARLEQLASVYGSMAPKEAAPLIARLDTETALSLMERMPGKRMGQILSGMQPDRAVELTKYLTDKRKL